MFDITNQLSDQRPRIFFKGMFLTRESVKKKQMWALKSGIRQGCPLLPLLCQHCPEELDHIKKSKVSRLERKM